MDVRMRGTVNHIIAAKQFIKNWGDICFFKFHTSLLTVNH